MRTHHWRNDSITNEPARPVNQAPTKKPANGGLFYIRMD
jgi:hypothetical protein